MNSRSKCLPGLVAIAIFCGGIASNVETQAMEVLLSDDFSGTAGDFIDSSKWKVPNGGDGASFGQTTVMTALTDLATTDGSAAILELDTFLPGNSGLATDRAFGHQFVSRSSYAVGGGLVWEARLRFGSSRDTGVAGTPGVIAPPPSGFVGGAFLFDVTNANNTAGDPLIRDETDVELLSKQPTSVLTNTFNDIGFSGPGSGGDALLVGTPVPGYSPFNYHDYKMEILPTATPGVTETKWYVDNTLIRTVTGSTSANEGMTPQFNLWMPDSGFTDAFDGNLSAPSAALNETYTLSVDSVSLTRLNTSKGTNLVSNGGFSADGETFIFDPITDWTPFNQTRVSPEAGDSGDGDGFALKTFQAGNANFDASGAFRDVPVTAGDELSFSVDALTLSGDSIAGNDQQFAEVWVRFEDAGGDVLAQRTGVIFDSGDPGGLTEDVWHTITLEATAPAGAVNANIQLAHVSNFVPPVGVLAGAIFWDNVQLNVLSVDSTPGDFDGDGDVDGDDFLEWQRTDGTPGGLADWQANYGTGTLASAVSAVPEPSSALLVLASLMALGASRLKSRS